MKQLIWISCLASLVWLTSCKSAYEKQGDEHVKAGRYLKALQRYAYVTKKGNGSKEFNENLSLAYIGALGQSASLGMDSEKLDFYRGKIMELLSTSGTSNKKLIGEYAKVISKVSADLMTVGDFQSDELAFRFINDIQKIGVSSPELLGPLMEVKNQYITQKIANAEGHYNNSVDNKDPNEGIVADYVMSKLALFVEPTEEMNVLWSQIREQNLSTYLMYDLEGLIDSPLPKINRFGVLLGIVKYDRGANTLIQVQAYNGSTGPVKFISDNFTLVDKEGNVHKPSSAKGSFSSKPLEAGHESKVGQLVFNVGKDVAVDYLHFKGETGESMKFLP